MIDYRNQFPDHKVQIMGASQKMKISENMKLKLQDEKNREQFLRWRSFPSEIKHWIRKGFSEEEARQKVFEFQQNQSLKGNNEKTHNLRSKKYSGKKNPMSLESIAEREDVSLKEAKKLTPCHGRTGEKHPMFGKKHSVEALKKISSAPHLSNPNYRSKNEIELEIFCQTLGAVEHNVHIGKWNVDVKFLTKNLIIEFFGDYWHMNPKKYQKNDMHNLMQKSAFEIWRRDAQKIQELRDQGFEVLVIWELEWVNDKELCLQRIKDAYNRIR